MINYKFQSKFTDDLNIPESFKLEMENEYAKQLWTGDGVGQDRAKAMDILEHLSKEYLDARAMNNLAWIYETGGVVRRDRRRAMNLYYRSFFNGDARAMSNLADKFLFDKESIRILQGFSLAYASAMMGEKNAMLTLAYCFIKGLGVVPDLGEAQRYLNKAGLKYGELPKFKQAFGVTPNPKKVRDLRLAILEMKDRIEESPFIWEPVKETVWVSPGLEFYPTVFRNLKDALESRGIPFRLLPAEKNKKHVWARDYMPVQVGKNRFVQQTYAPDYLEDDPSYIPDYCKIVSDVKPGKIITSKIFFDGGNVLSYGRTAIMTDKVFYENAMENSHELVEELRMLLEVDEMYIIPWDMNEPYGHADGMVRFVNGSTVVLNNFSNDNSLLGRRLKRFLEQNFIVKELHFEGKLTNRLNWGYINFLKVGDRLFVPQFGIQEDSQAIEQLSSIYSGCEIIPIFGCEELAKDGGVLNCVTWTTKE